MNPKFWLITKFEFEDSTDCIVEEFNTKEELNLAITSINTEWLVSLEVISGFTLTKRVV